MHYDVFFDDDADDDSADEFHDSIQLYSAVL